MYPANEAQEFIPLHHPGEKVDELRDWPLKVEERAQIMSASNVRKYVHEPRVVYEPEDKADADVRAGWKGRRTCSVVITALLCILAFMIGGGVGSGVTIGIESSRLTTNSSKTISTTNTSPTSSIPTLTVVDAANCPLINNTHYISSTSAVFNQICGRDIPGSDTTNSTETSFSACLDSCANVNLGQKGSCTAAT